MNETPSTEAAGERASQDDDDSAAAGISMAVICTKIASTPDGGWRISFDTSRDSTTSIMQLCNFIDSHLLELAVVPIRSVAE